MASSCGLAGGAEWLGDLRTPIAQRSPSDGSLTMSRTVWGHHTTENAEEARERIVDAAETAITRWGLARTRIDDIAEEARCGRSTIYRYFGNRENVIVQVLLRRGRGFADVLLRRVDDIPDPSDKIGEGVVFALKLIRDDELLWSI